MMFITLLILLVASIIYAGDAPQLTEPDSRDNSAQCDCYVVSGTDPGYFQYYRFWDFRSVPNDSNGNDYTSAPPLVTASENEGGQDITSPYFNTSAFTADWEIENYIWRADAAVPTINSAQNVFISRQPGSDVLDSTYLTLRTFRLDDFVSSAEIESNQKNVLYASIRVRMRMIPYFSNLSAPYINNSVSSESIDGVNETHPIAPGAVLGLFTWKSDTQESDIEILTSDPVTNIRYTNQPDVDAKTGDEIPGASTDTVLPNNTVWTDWHDHRIDWYSGISRWYVDDELVLEKTLNVPTEPTGFIINLWSDGGSWSGNMTVGAQVLVGIEWIEMAFNISGNNPSNKVKRKDEDFCNVGCNVDGVQDVGFPQVAFNTTSDNAGTMTRGIPAFAATSLQVAALLVVYWLL